jgi:hypothetical protein|tara:strand:- start:60 stop:545 length:486 start_codon:yes stop_codon:yes gene_type:complete
MPDWMSHIIIGLILAKLFNIRKKSLVVLGTLMPDILAKVQLIYFYFPIPPLVSFTSFHTPLMIFLLSIIIAPLFKFDKFKIILFINIGAISHFLADLTMKHFSNVGTRLFFPLPNTAYTFNLIWPEKSFYILIGSLIIYLTIRIVKRNMATSNRNPGENTG